MHPVDLEYIRTMVPNVSTEIVLQLKNLKPGNCIAFGSAFKVPTQLYVDLPNPRPLSNNVDLENVWYNDIQETPATAATGFGVDVATQKFAAPVIPATPAAPATGGAPAVPAASAAPKVAQPQAAPQVNTFIQQNTQDLLDD